MLTLKLKAPPDPTSGIGFYFYVRTKDPITPPQGNSWMNLLIKVEPETDPN